MTESQSQDTSQFLSVVATGVEEFCIAVIDRDFSFERFLELHLGAGEAEALRLGRDLEAAQDLIGGVQIVRTGQTQLAGEAILKGTPEVFDAALRLGTLGGNVGDAELIQSAAELRGFAAGGRWLLCPAGGPIRLNAGDG